MALRFADGFDQYDTDDLEGWWTQIYDGGAGVGPWYDVPTIDTTNARRSGRCLRFPGQVGSNAIARVVSDASGATFVCGFAFRGVPDSANGYTGWGGIRPWASGQSLSPTASAFSAVSSQPFNWIAQVRSGGFAHLALCLETNGQLSLVRGKTNLPAPATYPERDTTKIDTTADALHFDEWHYIEWKVVLHASAGSVVVKVDGDEWLNLTGIRTIATEDAVVPTATWDEFAIGRNLAGTQNSDWLVDDVYVLDGDTSDTDNNLADFLGDVAITWSAPTADGDVNNWTPSSGARYATVDEVPPDDDSTYIQSSTPGQVQTFATGGSPITGATIVAVGVMFAARRTDGGASQTRPVLRIGGVTYEIGVAKGNTTTYSYQAGYVNKKPSDHSAISLADFAAMQPGVKKVL